jgi:hypothetical protein
MARNKRVGWMVLYSGQPQLESGGMLFDAGTISVHGDARHITYDATLFPDKNAAVRAAARDIDARTSGGVLTRVVGEYALMPVAASPSRAEDANG